MFGDSEALAIATSGPAAHVCALGSATAVVTERAVHVIVGGLRKREVASTNIDAENDGAGRCACWHPDGDRLAVLTARGRVRILAVDAADGPPAVRSLAVAPASPAAAEGAWLTSDAHGVLAGCTSGEVALVGWSGGVLLRTTVPSLLRPAAAPTCATNAGRGGHAARKVPAAVVRRAAAPPTAPRAGGVLATHARFDAALALLALVVDGTASLVPVRSLAALADGSQGRACVLHRVGARCVALSARQRRVAVGCAGGEVYSYAVPPAGAMGPCASTPLATLSLRPWGCAAELTGAVRDLAYATDGIHLAVGWARRGMAVFGSGRALCAAWPPVERLAAAAPADDAPLARGAAAIAWGAADAWLVCAATGPDQEQEAGADRTPGRVWQLAITRRAAAASGSCAGAVGRASEDIVLLGEAHALLAAASPPGAATWRRVDVPARPVARGGPLLLGALSADGSRLAVTNARAALVCALGEVDGDGGGGWRTLARGHVHALCWLDAGTLLLVRHVAAASAAPRPHEAALMRADGPDARAGWREAACAPLRAEGRAWGCVRASDAAAVVGIGHELRVVLVGGGGGVLVPETPIALPPDAPRAIGLSCARDDAPLDTLELLVATEGGGMLVARARLPADSTHAPIAPVLWHALGAPSARGCHQCWHDWGGAWRLDESGLRHDAWSFSAGTYEQPREVLTLLSTGDGPLVAPQREAVPLAVLPNARAVIGGSAALTSHGPGPALQTQPWLDAELGALLSRGHVAEALELASHAPYRRDDCLERLVHSALLAADESGLDDGSGGGLLRRWLHTAASEGEMTSAMLRAIDALLRAMPPPTRCRVLARCARKSDASLWGRFFAVFGAPRDLLRECVEAGELSHAMMLLMPLLQIEGRDGCRSAVRALRSEAARARATGRGLATLAAQLDAFEARLDAAPRAG